MDQQKISELLKRRKRADEGDPTLVKRVIGDGSAASDAGSAPVELPTSTPVNVPALPDHYALLATQFEALDVVLSYFRASRRNPFFDVVAPQVQQMSKKNFTLEQLQQIMTLYPEAVSLKYIQRSSGGGTDMKWALFIEQQNRAAVGDVDSPVTPSSIMEARRREFRQRLTQRVLAAHHAFLCEHYPPLAGMQRTTYHSKFKPSELPPIEKAPLPVDPSAPKEMSRERLMLTRPEIAAAIIANKNAAGGEAAAAGAEGGVSASAALAAPPPPPLHADRPVPAALSGLSSGMLARIRAREAEMQQQRESLFSARTAARTANYGPLCDAVWSIATRHGKDVLPYGQVLNELAAGGWKTLPRDRDALAELLQEVLTKAPEFLSAVQLDLGRFLKINRDKLAAAKAVFQ